jgi:SAM-dependent methyltransferase
MRIDTSAIPSNDEEKIRAKEYWQQPGTQTLQYALLSHYVAVINRFIAYTGAKKILEFGCGSGRNLEQIRKELNNQYLDHPIHLRGIDINSDSLEFGRKNFSSELDLNLGDETILANEPNAYFDLVFTVSVLDHIPNPRFIIQELLSKTKRYAIFLEPIHPEEVKIEGKIEQISTNWSPQKDSKATPYTYFHSYVSIFDDFGAKVLIDLPMPTSVYKLGPLYRLFVVQKKDFVQESKASFTNLVEIYRY